MSELTSPYTVVVAVRADGVLMAGGGLSAGEWAWRRVMRTIGYVADITAFG